MSRTINESVNQLKTSLSDIKTSLSNKNIQGGEDQLKVSQIAGLKIRFRLEVAKKEIFQ